MVLAQEGPCRLLGGQGRTQPWPRLAGLCGGRSQGRRAREGPCPPTGPSHSPQRGSAWTWPRSAWAVSELALLTHLHLSPAMGTSGQGWSGLGSRPGWWTAGLRPPGSHRTQRDGQMGVGHWRRFISAHVPGASNLAAGKGDGWERICQEPGGGFSCPVSERVTAGARLGADGVTAKAGAPAGIHT